MSEESGVRPMVVVIGGGYGGVNVAKALDAEVEVVLIEPKDAFVHNVGALRALVEPSFAPSIFLPYDRLLTHGRVVQGRAVEVTSNHVVLASDETIMPDYVVLASGSTYPFPAKSNAHHADDAVDNYRAAYAELEEAGRVLLRRRRCRRDRARGRDRRQVAGEARHAARPRRRCPRRSVPSRPAGRAASAAHRPRCGTCAWRKPRSTPFDRGQRTCNIHRDDEVRPRHHSRHLVPVLRGHPDQRLPEGRPGTRAATRWIRYGQADAPG